MSLGMDINPWPKSTTFSDSSEYIHQNMCDVCQNFGHHSGGEKARNWTMGTRGSTKSKMKLQVLSTEFLLLCSRRGLLAHPAKLCICTTWAQIFSRQRTEWRERERERDRERVPCNKSLGNALFDLLPFG